MDDKTSKFLYSTLIGLSITAILSLGHVIYGMKLQGLPQQELLILDQYLFGLSYASLGLISGMYYLFKKDISSTIAIFISGFWGLSFGLQDILVYTYLGFFETTYPWLADGLPGLTASLFGTKVTNFMLFYNVLISGFIFGILVWELYKYEDKIYGLEI